MNSIDNKRYTVTLTGRQLALLADAIDVVSRLGIGQWRDSFNHLPTKEVCATGWHEMLDEVGQLVAPFLKHNVDGWSSHLGIHHRDVNNRYRELYDIHQVFRHKLSWDRLEARKLSGEGITAWSSMGVSFDEPFNTSGEELIIIEDFKE